MPAIASFRPAAFRTFSVVAWTLLGSTGLHADTEPRVEPPAVLVCLRPGVPRPPGALEFGALGRNPMLSPAGGAAQPGPLSGLAAHAAETGALGIEDVFGDLVPPDHELARVYRVVYRPGTDVVSATRSLALAEEVEWAEPNARFRLAWDDARRFLVPGSGADRPPGDPESMPVRPLTHRFLAADTLFLPDDPLFQDGSQWGLWNLGTGPFGGIPGADIRAPEGWALTTGSTATHLAIVDTGLDFHHPDLVRTLADGSPRVVRAYNSSVEGVGGSPWDSVGHGTMVAGVALALANNGPMLDGRGVAGVCGGAGDDSAGCRIIAVKATPTRAIDALGDELARGILFATFAGARAINLSFGGDEDSRVVRAAIEIAAERGTAVVCGAGNGQDARPQYPGYYARYGLGVSVAALKPDGALARFSSRGPQIDVAAPGENVYSTYLTYENAYQNPRRNFEYTSGTSFAAPHVTGLAGLACTLQPDLTDNEFQEFLRRTAEDAGAPGRDDTFGWGVPHARRLLERLAPPRSFERGAVQAATWSLVGMDSITLAKTDISINGCSADGRYLAERWEGRAHVVLPPGRFLEIPEVLVRVHGTRGYGPGELHEYDADQGEVVPGTVTSEGFDVRTYVYRIAASPPLCSLETGPVGYVPGPPGAPPTGTKARVGQIAWSAFGRRDGPPAVTMTSPPTDGAVWSVDEPETLRWEATDPDAISAFAIDRSLDGGATWQRVTTADLAGSAREYPWSAPCGPGDAPYLVRVTAFDRNGQADEGSAARRIAPSRRCFPGEGPDHSPSFALFPVLPNPAGGQVTFRYAAAASSAGTGGESCRLSVHDIRGRLVRSFEVRAAVLGQVSWDGRDAAGRPARPGVYLLRLEAGGEIAGSRFVYLGAGDPRR